MKNNQISPMGNYLPLRPMIIDHVTKITEIGSMDAIEDLKPKEDYIPRHYTLKEIEEFFIKHNVLN